jgi:hypothetical protein
MVASTAPPAYAGYGTIAPPPYGQNFVCPCPYYPFGNTPLQWSNDDRRPQNFGPMRQPTQASNAQGSNACKEQQGQAAQTVNLNPGSGQVCEI